MADFAAAKALLMRENPSQPGTNLYDHLTKVLTAVLEQPDVDAQAVLQSLSAAAKRSQTPASTSGEGEQGGVSHARLAATTAKAEWSAATQALFRAPLASELDVVQDLMGDMDALEWAGVGLGKEDAYRLTLSMRQLGTDVGQKLKSMRFFGKILGLQGDYYVVEGVVDGASPADSKAVEAKGTNACVYWVCSAIGAAWTKLPDCERKCVVAAGKIRKYLTGNLDAPVRAHPPFPGSERELLRAQIARIAAFTSVSPADFYTENEDDGSVVPNAEFGGADDDGLGDLGGWARHSLLINARGGSTVYTPPEVEGEEPPEDPEAPEPSPVLAGLGDDAAGAWCPPFKPESGKTVLRCLQWPGAVACAGGMRMVNMYVGFGVERPADDDGKAVAFNFVAPGAVATEFDDSTLAEQEDVQADPYVPPPEPEPEEPEEAGEGEEEEG